MTSRSAFITAGGVALSAAALPIRAMAQAPKANVLLVHGAFSDGSAWSPVIQLLQSAGHHVVAVQNPLTSLADDVANTKLQLNQLMGPTVVVGHSYGGAVISGAARDAHNLKSLVYVTAIAPDDGESTGELLGKFPTTVFNDFVPSGPSGFVICDPAKFPADFAADVPAAQAAVLAATQKPTAGAAFAVKSGPPAWKQVPCFYAVSTQDQAINPLLQRYLAKRMNATTIDVPASHFSMISHPREIAGLIVRAAA